MVMGRRPQVSTSSWPIAAIDLVGLGAQLATAMARVPFRRPFAGEGSRPHNLTVAVTRETIRSFMGYSSSLPIEEFRSVELVLDDLCRLVMPPVVAAIGADSEPAVIGGVPGNWYRPRGVEPVGTILYLHGGGYVGTSPTMYAAFTAWLCRHTGCEVFVADYRLAPEFPFPAGVEDAVVVLEALLHQGADPARLFLAGDSGGGGLASTVLYVMEKVVHRPLAGVLLFSPEVDLRLNEPSVSENAGKDILPWNIPTSAYLHGRDPSAAYVSAVDQDVTGWPPALVAFGDDEMFRDPIRRFVEHLQTFGVETVALEEPGMFHVFPILMPWAEASRRVFRAVAAFVSERLAAADAVTEAPAPPQAG
jgi:monoterpene epsilon-lactone hydrolase